MHTFKLNLVKYIVRPCNCKSVFIYIHSFPITGLRLCSLPSANRKLNAIFTIAHSSTRVTYFCEYRQINISRYYRCPWLVVIQQLRLETHWEFNHITAISPSNFYFYSWKPSMFLIWFHWKVNAVHNNYVTGTCTHVHSKKKHHFRLQKHTCWPTFHKKFSVNSFLWQVYFYKNSLGFACRQEAAVKPSDECLSGNLFCTAPTDEIHTDLR